MSKTCGVSAMTLTSPVCLNVVVRAFLTCYNVQLNQKSEHQPLPRVNWVETRDKVVKVGEGGVSDYEVGGNSFTFGTDHEVTEFVENMVHEICIYRDMVHYATDSNRTASRNF